MVLWHDLKMGLSEVHCGPVYASQGTLTRHSNNSSTSNYDNLNMHHMPGRNQPMAPKHNLQQSPMLHLPWMPLIANVCKKLLACYYIMLGPWMLQCSPPWAHWQHNKQKGPKPPWRCPPNYSTIVPPTCMQSSSIKPVSWSYGHTTMHLT